MNRCAKRSGSIVILALLSSCGDGDVRECGEGTALQGGLCVAEPPGDVRCGEGTVVDGESGFCVPLVGCGEGTVVDPATGNCSSETECGPGTFLDLVTKSCVTETACGTGTVADEATRTCKPSVRCGAGTTLDEETDRCLPDPPCVPDAILDPVTGLCESDLECGEGYVLIGGVCFDEDASIAAEADASESVPDRNDPLQGGTAEPLTLEPIGSRAVFTGGIGRPADLSSTGAAQQDRDVWRFVGSAGQYLRIEVRSMGLPQPAFILEGPDGYERTSSVGYDSDAAREVVLPYDGVYELIILPSAFLITGIPMGDPTTAYVGIVEELPLPTPVDLTAGAAPDAPANIQGQLLNLDDNFYRIRVPGRTALQATIIGDVAETVPSILVFDASMRLLADVANLKKDDWAGFFVDTMDDCILVVDWQVSTARADDFSIDVHAVPLLDRGSLAADFNAVTENQDLAGLRTGAYRFAIAEAQVIVADVFGLSAPDVQVVGPAGTRTRIKDDDEFFFYAEPGEYVMFIHNDLTSDSVDVGTVLGLITPYDLGSLTEGQSSSVAGQPIVSGFSGYADAWVVVTSSVPALVTLEVEARGGDPDLAVYRIDGTLVRGIPRPHMYRPARIVNRDPRPVLLRLMPDGKNVVDWTIHAEVGPLPAHIDGEPNDVQSRAIALGIAPTIVRSTVTTEDTDLYTFSLAEPLAEGRAIRVGFDDLESESATTSITRGSYLRVYDAAMQPLSSIPTPESDGGVLGVNTAISIASSEGAGPF